MAVNFINVNEHKIKYRDSKIIKSLELSNSNY